MFFIGKKLLGTGSGVLGALLLAVSAFHIDHSSEARGYSGLALFSILSSLYFLEGVRADEGRSWILYVCFTVLGFCSHVFMVAVSIAQIFSILIFAAGLRWMPAGVHATPRALRNAVVSLFCAGAMTLLIYSPILPVFFQNLGKVRLVSINRLPFVIKLFDDCLFPGITSTLGGVTYGALLCAGMYFTFRKDRALFLYLAVLFFIPLSLYLLANPMFVFERYFIFLVLRSL